MAEKQEVKQETKTRQAQTKSFHDKVSARSESAVGQFKKKHPEDAFHVDSQVRAGKAVIARNHADNISREDMTMEEYKSFINGLLNSIPFDATRIYDREIISISDAGWEQMKNDPDYEAWVLGYTVENRSVRNPFFGLPGASGNCYIEKFGASIEEHIGQSIGTSGPVSRSNHARNEKSWWEKRHQKMKEQMRNRQRLQRFLSDGTQGSTDRMHFQPAGMNALAAMAYEDNISTFSRSVVESQK